MGRRLGSSVLVVGVAGLLGWQIAVAADLIITAPVGKPAYAPGSRVRLNWAGGQVSRPVNIQIVDVKRWAVVDDSNRSVINDGDEWITLPRNLRCGDPYQFYVEMADRSQWTYGGDITVVCDGGDRPDRPPPPPPPQSPER
jgi:hypothetical protein